jgi:hypothetical protein
VSNKEVIPYSSLQFISFHSIEFSSVRLDGALPHISHSQSVFFRTKVIELGHFCVPYRSVANILFVHLLRENWYKLFNEQLQLDARKLPIFWTNFY